MPAVCSALPGLASAPTLSTPLPRESTEGRVLLEGRDTASLSGTELANLRLARLGFVFQFHFLLPEFSTLDNVLIPIRRLGRLKDAAARAQAMKLLETLGMAEAAARNILAALDGAPDPAMMVNPEILQRR